MADFEYGDELRADFSNTFADELKRRAFISAFHINPRSVPGERELDSYTRSYCIISAHSINVTGLDGWQPPGMYASEEAIQANAQEFLGKANRVLIVAWAEALNAKFFGKPAAVPADQQGTGTDEDFLAQKGNASTSGSSTSRRKRGESRSRTRS